MPQHGLEANKSTRLSNQRHSIQPSTTETENSPNGSFRHTQSHRYRQGSIQEIDSRSVAVEVHNEKLKPKRASSVTDLGRKSNLRQKNEVIKEDYAYDNASYDKHSDKVSVASNRPRSSRASSVQSLEVVREQYCCFAKRTKCEKRLVLAIIILSIAVLALVAVIVVMATSPEDKNFKLLFSY